jgi:hypothetical protein
MLPNFADKFFAALTAAGLPEIPREFSVVPYRHVIPSATVAAIDAFIRIFDRVTTRPARHLRVWAYRGERFLISARASKRADLLDLASPGGWLPTFVQN